MAGKPKKKITPKRKVATDRRSRIDRAVEGAQTGRKRKKKRALFE